MGLVEQERHRTLRITRTWVTINAEVFCQQLNRVNETLGGKWTALINRKGVIFQHDNARLHASKQTPQKIRSLGWKVLPPPPYSPDLAPTDFLWFRSTEHFIRSKTFKSREGVKISLQTLLQEKK